MNGDQFQHTDKRVLSGVNVKHTEIGDWAGREVENTAGLQARNDDIAVGLHNTAARRRLSSTRHDDVVERSVGVFFQNSVQWNGKLRSVAGVRADYFWGDVASDEAGLRTAIVPSLQSSLHVFRFDFDSELLFVGDAGTTEPSRPSRRVGVEWANLYTPTSWLTIDADVAFTQARFSTRIRRGPHSGRR